MHTAVALLVAALVFAATAIVYVTGGTAYAYTHLGYVPILAGAVFFRLPGAVATAMALAVLLGPLMPLDVASGAPQTTANWVFRGMLFLLIGGLAGLAFEIRSRQLSVIQRLGYYNPLTGLPNRARCMERLDRLIQSGATAQSPIWLLSLRIGHLGAITSSIGHEEADELQKAVAARLKNVLPEDAKLFHFGSGEFALVAIAASDKTRWLASQLIGSLKEPLIVDNVPIRCDLIVGLAQLGVHARDPLTLLRASLSALEDAEATGRAVQVFDAHKDRARRAGLRLLSDLQSALGKSDEITLHYQPKVELRTGACVGAEALVRWHHPELGWIAPGDFVPLAERTDLIRPLADRVLELAVGQLAAWKSEGLYLPLAVNLAVPNLEDDGLPDRLAALLERHGVRAEHLEIEVTESAVVKSFDSVRANLNRLRSRGIAIALDDFGTGQSSIAYLRDFPVQTMKLDRSFLQGDTLATPEGRLLVETTIEACHKLGFKITAEGIETMDAYDLLRAMSCDFGQGYHIAPPLTEPGLKQWLAGHSMAASG